MARFVAASIALLVFLPIFPIRFVFLLLFLFFFFPPRISIAKISGDSNRMDDSQSNFYPMMENNRIIVVGEIEFIIIECDNRDFP